MKTWRSYDGLMNNERSVKIASPLGGQQKSVTKIWAHSFSVLSIISWMYYKTSAWEDQFK